MLSVQIVPHSPIITLPHMLRKGVDMPNADMVVLAADWRDRVRPLVASERVNQADVAARLTELAGRAVDQSTVSRWLRGTVPRVGVLQEAMLHMREDIKAGVWPAAKRLSANGGSRQVHEPRPPVWGATPEMDRELDGYWIEELRRISESDVPETIKMLDRDSLASAIGRVSVLVGERAAEARARAIEKAEDNAKARMAEVNRERMAARRKHATDQAKARAAAAAKQKKDRNQR